MMEPGQIDLYEFLTESELQHYYNSIKNELKITNASQFKYATDEDLKQIGLSRPEIRRLRKFYEKYYPHGYLSKIKRLLQAPTTIVKREDGGTPIAHNVAQSTDPSSSSVTTANSPNKVPNNKHIIPADAICVNKQLGTGEFGIVQQGVWTNGTERIQVAIKCLCRERMQSNPMEFLKEAAIMHSIEHENIVRLYGVVLATDSLMLVTELAHLRSLLECLKDSGLRVSFLTIPTLCEFAMQICNGMKYLENKRLIHRDLAARNILVFSKNKVKISDFGLSRALGVGKDYYKTNFNVNLKLPIAWCAPECINYLRFTNASDVWAFGVCLWEMFSYGFQPWAALTGLQILEAIDAPNYQRLEQPECCPREYYHLMMKCWQEDPIKRPKFSEIYELLPDMKPEQLKTVINCCEPKKDHLLYRQGEIITVLDRNTGTPFWKGVLSSGKTGLFNPANTVAYLEGLPSSNRDSFCRTNERCSKRKLRTEMISMPQNDFKHTGHVGIDGDSFGDVAFLGNSQNYSHVPRQIVTPYKPSEDIEQTPLLLPPTPTSPDSLQTASGYFPEENATSSTNPTFVSSNENTPKQHNTFGDQSSFDFSAHPKAMMHSSTNPFAVAEAQAAGIGGVGTINSSSFALQNNNYGLEASAFTNANIEENSLHHAGGGVPSNHRNSLAAISSWPSSASGSNVEDQHEYHEISDDEITSDKFDFGPSLLDEINSMFGSMNTAAAADFHPKSPDFEHTNKKNEFTEMSSKSSRKNSGGDSNGNKTTSSSSLSSSKKKTSGTVKPISVKDEKILNHAIEIANEISARSMTDLVSEQAPATQSPKRKFSFRFPHLSHHGSHDKSAAGGCSNSAAGGASSSGYNGNAGTLASYSKDKKNFSEGLKSIPDLQSTITEEGREAYNSLIERKATTAAAAFLSQLNTNEFELAAAKTLPRRSIHLRSEDEDVIYRRSGTLGSGTHHHQLHHHKSHHHNHELTIPLQDAPRPMTLPTRGSGGKLKKSELITNPKFHPLKMRPRTLTNDGEENDENSNSAANGVIGADKCASTGTGSDKESLCESPSYLTNTFYTFPDKEKGATTATAAEDATAADNYANPIPLPPRDRNKVIKTNPKRHVRKYPLIIPAYGVQRTLNKVTEITPVDDEPKVPFPGTDGGVDRNLNHLPISLMNESHQKCSTNHHLRRVTHEAVAAVRPTSMHSATYENTPLDDSRTYQNVQDMQKNYTENSSNTDSASLQFESILEDDFNKVNVLQSPDVTDGFYNFSIQKEHYNKSKEVDFDSTKISSLYANEDELRNLDILEKKNVSSTSSSVPYVIATSSTTPTSAAATTDESTSPKSNCRATTAGVVGDVQSVPLKENSTGSELAGHALFNKIRETVDLAMNRSSSSSSTSSTSESRPLSRTGDQRVAGTSTTKNETKGSSTSALRREPAANETKGSSTSALRREPAATETKNAHLKDSNSVSCEDLLEFSDKKPKGCERGVDSDEVRIMMKVLGKDSTPSRCLHVLEFIEWDVHKAIKLIKLQNILSTIDLSLTESVEALQKYEWDLQITAMKLKGLK